MKYIRSDEEIQSIREACQVAATVLKQLVDVVEEDRLYTSRPTWP